ncbi:MAG TPA: hypothetical protein DCQ98_01755 [Planctomycetaceae bacterium]|nr:hypothetical protein [Planctomycetaceae bacterium]HRF01638.1 hypothetical protein [Pirellulaceae bacterium]
MIDLRRVLIGAVMIGQLLLGLGSDLAHRCIDPSCADGNCIAGGCETACGGSHVAHDAAGSDSDSHRHAAAHACSSHRTVGRSESAAADHDASASTRADRSRRERPEAGWTATHDVDGCALCRQLTRPAFQTPASIVAAGSDPVIARLIEPRGRLAIHRSLGHDGRGPPADLL